MAFKGALVELAARDVNVRREGETFLVPFAVCAQSIGAGVAKTAGRVTIELYGVTAVFEQDSATALRNGEPFALSHPVIRGDRGELYAALDDVAAIFDLRWVYAARNNILDIDYSEEDYPRSRQPEPSGSMPVPHHGCAFGGIRAPGVNP